jgi:hypothetical protein
MNGADRISVVGELIPWWGIVHERREVRTMDTPGYATDKSTVAVGPGE